ncbi:MAG: hypothetical protein B7C24_13625, partial [Bacteroidetes bacterium 4572_77]
GTVYRHDIINPGAEEGDTTGWSVSHGTVLALEGVAVPPFSGVYYFVGSPGESISGIHQYLNTADANIPNEFIDAGLMSTFISWKQGFLGNKVRMMNFLKLLYGLIFGIILCLWAVHL